MEIKAKVKQLGNFTEGVSARGEWKKQEVIVETIEQYPKTICVTFWGERADAVQNVKAGDTLSIGISVESREFNGKWYTEAKAYSVTSVSTQYTKITAPTAIPQPTNINADDYFADVPGDLPFDYSPF